MKVVFGKDDKRESRKLTITKDAPIHDWRVKSGWKRRVTSQWKSEKGRRHCRTCWIGKSARLPLSTSDFFTQSFSMCAEQPNLGCYGRHCLPARWVFGFMFHYHTQGACRPSGKNFSSSCLS